MDNGLQMPPIWNGQQAQTGKKKLQEKPITPRQREQEKGGLPEQKIFLIIHTLLLHHTPGHSSRGAKQGADLPLLALWKQAVTFQCPYSVVLGGQADYIMLGDWKALDFYSENPVDGFGQGHDLT